MRRSDATGPGGGRRGARLERSLRGATAPRAFLLTPQCIEPMAMFENRNRAGMKLARALQKFSIQSPIVYALPRGGLPVAAAIADALNAPLDIILVRKLSAPNRRELAIGAVVDGAKPTVILNEDVIFSIHADTADIEREKAAALDEIERRRALYFKNREWISPIGQTAILVDDGLATGATMEAAVKAIRKAEPAKIIVAVPTAPSDTVSRLQKIADEVVCLEAPILFVSVGSQYRDFPQLADSDVIRILDQHRTANARTDKDESLLRERA